MQLSKYTRRNGAKRDLACISARHVRGDHQRCGSSALSAHLRWKAAESTPATKSDRKIDPDLNSNDIRTMSLTKHPAFGKITDNTLTKPPTQSLYVDYPPLVYVWSQHGRNGHVDDICYVSAGEKEYTRCAVNQDLASSSSSSSCLMRSSFSREDGSCACAPALVFS